MDSKCITKILHFYTLKNTNVIVMVIAFQNANNHYRVYAHSKTSHYRVHLFLPCNYGSSIPSIQRKESTLKYIIALFTKRSISSTLLVHVV